MDAFSGRPLVGIGKRLQEGAREGSGQCPVRRFFGAAVYAERPFRGSSEAVGRTHQKGSEERQCVRGEGRNLRRSKQTRQISEAEGALKKALSSSKDFKQKSLAEAALKEMTTLR